jgi:hypothetical protein
MTAATTSHLPDDWEKAAEEELGRLVEGDGERQTGRVSARHLPPDGAVPRSQRTVRGREVSASTSTGQ